MAQKVILSKTSLIVIKTTSAPFTNLRFAVLLQPAKNAARELSEVGDRHIGVEGLEKRVHHLLELEEKIKN